jgi:hypothetical protein
VELAQAALDHLGDDVGRLARLAGLLGQHRALALDRGLVEVGDGQRLRVGRRHVHGELLGERRELGLVARRLERHQHADLAEIRRDRVVGVGHDDAVRHR